MIKLALELAHDESGATVIEYALVASFIFVAIATVLGEVGVQLTVVFTGISTALAAAH